MGQLTSLERIRLLDIIAELEAQHAADDLARDAVAAAIEALTDELTDYLRAMKLGDSAVKLATTRNRLNRLLAEHFPHTVGPSPSLFNHK